LPRLSRRASVNRIPCSFDYFVKGSEFSGADVRLSICGRWTAPSLQSN